jgi:hypothetical protein
VSDAGPANRVQVSPLLGNGIALALHCIEGVALVMLCQCRQPPRKMAVNLLKEIKALLPIICPDVWMKCRDDTDLWIVCCRRMPMNGQ